MVPPPSSPRGDVLIVDDDAGVRDVCTTLLHVLGYRTHDVPSGEQALATLGERESDVNLVLLDLQMPKMDGERVLEELRQKHPSTRVLLMSGRARGDLAQFLGAGANAVLKKPFGLSELDSGVMTALNA